MYDNNLFISTHWRNFVSFFPENFLNDVEKFLQDILEPSLTPSVEPDASSWYDQQLEMGSTYAQHGFCYYTSRCLSLGSEVGFQNTVDLAKEMLASSTNVMALGKLLTQGNINSQNLYDGSLHIKAPRYGISIGRYGLISSDNARIIRCSLKKQYLLEYALNMNYCASLTMHLLKQV